MLQPFVAVCTSPLMYRVSIHLVVGSASQGYLKNPFVVKEGYVEIPQGPGLGIELDDDFIATKLFAGDW